VEDRQIIELYHRRDESAIAETDRKYGAFCRRIAMNILTLREDAEECVNDTWHAAWRRMPPERPVSLGAFLGRITRNLSISRFRAARAQKRYAGMELLLSELEECVPSAVSVEKTTEERELSEQISRWLEGLPQEDGDLFIRRYWYGDGVAELAAAQGVTPNQMAQRMLRLRKGLKAFLETEGVAL